jgi:type I restriction enzyme S subunit
MKDIKTNIPLPEVVWFQEGPGVRNTQYTISGVKLLNVANLVDGKIDLSTSDRYISEEEAYGRYKHFMADEGDLIIASSGIKVEYIDKKIGFIHKEHLPLCMNTSTIRFKVIDDKELNIKFFMYFLKSNEFKHQLFRHITGCAQLNFGPSHLKKMIISYPPLPEQSRIVEELDLLSNIIEKKRQQLSELDNLAQSIFYDMFGDPVTNEKGWEVKTIEEVCLDIIRGPFGSALKKEYFVPKGLDTYKVYEQKHAIQKDVSLGAYYISSDRYQSMMRFTVYENDIIEQIIKSIKFIYKANTNYEFFIR